MNNFLLQTQGEFKCELCPSRFTRNYNLDKHKKNVHSGKTPHVCSLCSAKFNNYKSLRYHIQRYHSETALKVQFIGQNSNAGETKERKSVIKQRAEERRHKLTSCPKRPIAPIRNKFYLLSLKAKFKCSFCPKRSTQKNYVKHHEIKVHSGNTPFICSICSSAFNREHYLRFHIMYHHRNTALYSDIIGTKLNTTATKKYPERSNLTVQEESNDVLQPSTVSEKSRENSSEKDQLICTKCDKSFSTINWLARHKIRFHSKNSSANQKHGKSFQCSSCNVTFTTDGNRIRHERRFHSRNFFNRKRRNLTEAHQRDAQQRCKISDTNYRETQPESKSSEQNTRRSKSSGRVVTRTPGGVEMIYADKLCCYYCPKFFATEGSKQIHEKIHSGDWAYQCKYCFVLFRLPQILAIHEKKCLTLTDTIWCQFCDYQNKLQSEVDNHYRITHGFDGNQSKIQVSDANQSETSLPEESEDDLELSSFIDVPKEKISSEDENSPENNQENDDHWSQFILISDDDD